MAVAFRAVGGLAPANGVTSAQPLAPTGQAVGDLTFTEVFVAAAKTLSLTAGWTILFQGQQGAFTYGIGYKVITSAGERPTWSWSGNANHLGSNTWAFTGAFASDPVGNRSHNVGSGTSAAAGSVTAQANNSYLMSWVGVVGNQTVPIPSGFSNVNNFSSAAFSERASQKNVNAADTNNNTSAISSATWCSSLIEIQSEADAAVPKFSAFLFW